MGIEDSSSSSHCHVCHLVTVALDANTAAALASSSSASPPSVNQTLLLLLSTDPNLRVHAAKEIRRMTKTSHRYRRHFSAAVGPLVEMLRSHSADANEAALAALLNLAVKDEKNKIDIVNTGALRPIIDFLQSENVALQEHAAAALLTLSASPANKPIIGSYGAIPLLIEIVGRGKSQAKFDAVMALQNLSTHPYNLSEILQTKPIPPLVHLLKSCKPSSKPAEKCTALIESLMAFEEGRTAILSEKVGLLAVVEVLERGSLQSREHAVGALLTLCQSDRLKYREPILKEGVIPGLLELTIQGTPKSQSRAQMLLRMLRETPFPRSELQPDTLENIVCSIISEIDDEDEQSEKAKQVLAEMVQVSMEQSLRLMQKWAVVYEPDPIYPSEVPSK